ncbi:hypothetical protein [Thiocystis violascens]|uniref:Uncharacterized protein n=1 Tax=Thiocystis violascens (strain ATCC 17096 / DSM 198 / 6111) TaxID=765911 RepID=I3YC50_THIV6|nr:hypothetical protein [Thiocystis violascens]AFL74568.1 hypothetical protein Thivi_2637 [Thiocystis violascens DSM 198]
MAIPFPTHEPSRQTPQQAIQDLGASLAIVNAPDVDQSILQGIGYTDSFGAVPGGEGQQQPFGEPLSERGSKP